MIGDILQPTHLLFILVIALLVLGPKRLPEVGRSLGRGLRDFRSALNGDEPERSEEVSTSVTRPEEVLAPATVAAETPPTHEPTPPPAPPLANEAAPPAHEPAREPAEHAG